ncbi:MAG: tetratricopeptide repeat protein [Candidatus Binataceae bacterium]
MATKSKKRAGRSASAKASRREQQTATPARPPRSAAQTSVRGSLLDSPALAPWIAVGVTLLVYLRCFGNAFVYDDHEMIDLNPLIGQWSFIWKSFGHDLWWFRPNGTFPKSNYYRPLQDVWLGLNYQIFGFNPVGWHISIVLVHLVSVYALYQVGLSLTKSRYASCAGATLFGVLPIGVQAAAWPCAIPFPMVAAFYLGSMWFFIERNRAPRRNLAISLALFVGGLLSHELAVMMPGLLIAYVFILEDAPPDGADTSRKPELRELVARAADAVWKTAPYLALAAIYLALRIVVLGHINGHSPGNHATLAQVLMSIPSALAHYALMLTLPWMAGPAHAFTFANSLRSEIFYLPALGLTALAAAGYLLLRKHPHRRLYFFLVLWMLFEIAPVMNLGGLMRVMLIQDRYEYLAAFGWVLLLGDIAACYAARGGETRNLATAIAVTAIAVYSVATWHTESYYHDEYTLFTKCIREDPSSTLCHGRLGMLLEQQRDWPGAEREFQTDIDLNPEDGPDLYNLGRLHAAQGHYQEADEEMGRALKMLGDQVPMAFDLELARVADKAGDTAGADSALKIAEADPKSANSAQYMRASFMAEHHDYSGAETLLRAIAAKSPSVQVIASLGSVMDLQGDHAGAIIEYQRALAISPNNPLIHTMLAQSLHAQGRDTEALAQCKQALAIQPANAAARALAAKLEAAGASSNKLSR